jgi:hypothetical protein
MNTTKPYKIVAITQVHNELRKGNLERFITYVLPNVDDLVIYDDVSTDGSYEYCKKYTTHTLRGTKNSFTNEWQIKQKLVEKALTLNPDFILLIDADEVITDNDGTKLQQLASWVIEKDLDGALIHDINLWKSRSWKRVDSDFDSSLFPRFWRVRDGKLTYTNRQGGLHQSPAPDEIKNLKRQDIVSFLHFGFADEKSIVTKYITYASHGQKGENLARFINEEGLLKTKKMDKNLYPTGLWIDDEEPKAFPCLEWYQLIAKHKAEITRPTISIVCLIYQSTAWLEFVYNQVVKYSDLTDKEFFFIANDATPEVKKYLHDNYIPHYILDNTEEHKKEWYINNVYRGYNFGAEKAKGDFIMFINSDMGFSPNWIEKAFSHYDGTNCVASQLVQNDKFATNEPNFIGVEKNLGYHISDYKENEFIALTEEITENKLLPGGSYMPLLIKKEDFVKVGGYPEGNIKVGSDPFNPEIALKGEALISGDVAFMKKLEKYAIKHMTALDSIAYHFQEGEKQDVEASLLTQKPLVLIANGSLKGKMNEKVLWDFMLERLPRIAGIDYKIVGSDEVTFSEKAKQYIDSNYPETQIIIQNASFIDLAHSNLYTIAFLQDDLRRMKRISPQQEETLLLSNGYVSNSTYTAASYPEYYFNVVNIGIDTELFRPGDKNKMREKYSIPKNKKVGIFVGELSEVKGWSEIAPIIKKHQEIHWIIVTKGFENFKATNVSFFKQVPQSILSELHQCSDFFIIGSKVETLCLAAMEACCCNIPVIMRKIGVFADFTDDELSKCGIFGDNFEESITKLDKQSFTPRSVMLARGLDINNTIDMWWEIIARTRLLKPSSKFSTSHLYTRSAAIRRKIKRVLNKNFVIVVAKRNLPPKLYNSFLDCWRFSKKTIRNISKIAK